MPNRFPHDDEPPVYAPDAPGGAGSAGGPHRRRTPTPLSRCRPWFADSLTDRATRKPSPHTMKAYRQHFTAVAALLTGGDPARVALTDITKNTMRAAFAAYAATHQPASIRRCWSTWNVLCEFLYTGELIAANPMSFVGRPKADKTLPRALPQPAVAALLDAVDSEPQRRTDWPEGVSR